MTVKNAGTIYIRIRASASDQNLISVHSKSVTGTKYIYVHECVFNVCG